MKVKLELLVFFVLSLLVGGIFLFQENRIGKEIEAIEWVDFNLENSLDLSYLKLFSDLKEEFILNKKDFLEVNLAEMKIAVFKDGSKEKEVAILAKGDESGWGGSAVGLYNIERGFKLSFSSIEEVYMPYALHYYGKYYIHGEPYYPGGEKLDSSVSGGCLRLKDEDARSVFELTDLDMPVLVIDKNKEEKEYPEVDGFPSLSARGYLVADLDSGHIFSEKNLEKVFPIASLTKLMTAVTVAENVSLKRSVLIKQTMLDNGYGSTDGLEPEERFRVVELFYPLLIESSNDAAYALTYFLGRERTIELMNEKAESILMEKTTFVEPSGFSPENVSTVKDLFYLARYILNNRYPLLEISKGNRVTSFGPVRFDFKEFWNKNIFIYDPTFIGGKTGFIKASKNTGLFIFNFKGRNIAFIFLGSSDLKLDTQKSYIWLQKNIFN